MAGLSLRERLVRAGGYLVGREVLATVLKVAAALMLTRLLGPTNFGLYAGAMAFVLVARSLCIVGLDAWLIRLPESQPKSVDDQAFSLLAATSTVAGALLFGLALLGAALLPIADYAAPLQVLALLLPFSVLAIPSTARLERELRYRPVVTIDLSSTALNYSVALVLALLGAGVWALVAGFGVQCISSLAGTMFVARYRPAWRWSRSDMREIVGYGLSYSLASWVFQLRELVSPLVVGGFLGPAAVGHIALANRLLDALAVVKRATGRLSMIGLARVQADAGRLREMHTEATVLQTLGTGPVLAAGAIALPWVIGPLLGSEWEPVSEIFPLLAVTTLVGTLFNLHSQVLFVLRRNRAVVKFRAGQTSMFAVAALVLVPWIGLVGYGVAEIVRLAAFAIVHRQVKDVFTPSYRKVMPLLVAFLPPLAAPYIEGPWALLTLLPAGLVFCRRRTRLEVVEYARLMFGAMRSRAAA